MYLNYKLARVIGSHVSFSLKQKKKKNLKNGDED